MSIESRIRNRKKRSKRFANMLDRIDRLLAKARRTEPEPKRDPIETAVDILFEPLPREEPERSREVTRRADKVQQLLTRGGQ